MNNRYYIGTYRKDALHESHRGWIVGTFLEDAPRKNSDVEIKYWEYKKGEASHHPEKISSIIECTFILTGKTRARIDNQDVILNAGDYIVIHPGTPNNTIVEILEDTTGLTIKSPSDPTAKTII